jgi:hypothetical protein
MTAEVPSLIAVTETQRVAVRAVPKFWIGAVQLTIANEEHPASRFVTDGGKHKTSEEIP